MEGMMLREARLKSATTSLRRMSSSFRSRKKPKHLWSSNQWTVPFDLVSSAIDGSQSKDFFLKHCEFLKQRNRRIRDRELERLHHETFPIWFRTHVHKLQLEGSEEVSDEVAILALGPRDTSIRFSGYIINGVRYHTKERELRRKTQNSGVMLKAKTSSYSSARDMNPQEGDVTYYGRITDMVELYYTHDHKHVLFNCDWIDKEWPVGTPLTSASRVSILSLTYIINTRLHENF
ncbi:hypothetical protein RHGRI_004467 [Rhododendron griersonianum]|uniref:DUF4216 domain-containing protein n=1 Tax=Rhododendron griersonianum TaxID=479676 RepID=A0AAV6L9L7_9ERIC|nr:hypothetical protein RHGRI_004467 [Rhododendron griersonianum]